MSYLIGVSGHIRIAAGAPTKIEDTVRQVLQDRLREQEDIRVATALAEGADRLVARVAQELGLELVAVLTCPETKFEEDFASKESRKEFRRLLDSAKEVHRPYLADAEHENIYVHADGWLCRNCDEILALWDGKPTEHAAGTARVVAMRRGEGESPAFPGDHRGEVTHIMTPREGDDVNGAGKVIS